MALRQIRIDGDPILRKRSREVEEVSDKIKLLLEDMEETMYHAEGVGLAAPQIGILKRIVLVDVGEGLFKMINPVIRKSDGSEIGPEGCLSVPNRSGTVDRPTTVEVDYIDENGQEVHLVAEGYFARAICHEIDHLDGILYIDKMIEEFVYDEEDEY